MDVNQAVDKLDFGPTAFFKILDGRRAAGIGFVLDRFRQDMMNFPGRTGITASGKRLPIALFPRLLYLSAPSQVAM